MRIWAMRSTLHMVAAEDATWLVGFLGSRLLAAGSRRRLELGLDEELCERGLQAITAVLAAKGPLTRAELVRQVRAKGIVVDPKTQAPAHLIAFAAMRGVVCRGPDIEGDEPTYVLTRDWLHVRDSLGPDQSLAELARRYLAAYGPAGPDDFASWSGITLGQCRRGFQLIAREIREVDVGGRRQWVLGSTRGISDGDPLSVRLLGRFDAYLLGYRSRDFALAPQFAKRIQAGGGIIRAALLVDGRVRGTWRHERLSDGVRVVVEPFEPFGRNVLPRLQDEVDDVGRFLGTPAKLVVSD